MGVVLATKLVPMVMGLGRRRFPASSSYEGDKEKEKFLEDTLLSHVELLSSGSVKSSQGGSQTAPEVAQNLDQTYILKSYPRIFQNGVLKPPIDMEENYVINSSSPSSGGTKSSSDCVSSDFSNPSSNRSDLSMNSIEEGPVHEDIVMHSKGLLEFGHCFQEGYYKANAGCPELMEDVTDADGGNGGCQKEKSEDDSDSDDMFGGVFDFSEEG